MGRIVGIGGQNSRYRSAEECVPKEQVSRGNRSAEECVPKEQVSRGNRSAEECVPKLSLIHI